MNFFRISTQDAIRATVAYADIFDYPLTREELRTWMIISSKKIQKVRGIDEKNGLFYVHRRSALIKFRQARQFWQEKKWNIARRAAWWLSLIPTIHLVGVTGGLAMNNADEDDDIDLFIITAFRALWISRLLATGLMQLVGLRRKPDETYVKNKVCLNMFMAPRYTTYALGLDIPSEERDCFSAHEVLQMCPIWEQPGIYHKFIGSNGWVDAYLPCALALKQKQQVVSVHRTPSLVIVLFRIFEYPAKMLQLWYMRKRRTSEVITDTIIRFHPKDARIWVKRKLAARLVKFNIPLDKVFYAR